MISRKLLPLLSRLKNPSENDPLGALLTRALAPYARKLIKEGIDSQLAESFSNQEALEEFVLRAAIIIASVRTKEERKADDQKYIEKKINKICDELELLNEMARNQGSWHIKSWKELEAALINYKARYLRKMKTPARPRPAPVDMLTDLFKEYLPGVSNSFIDAQTRKMLSPFGIQYGEGSIRVRKHRDSPK